jgi:hypothetical protein
VPPVCLSGPLGRSSRKGTARTSTAVPTPSAPTRPGSPSAWATPGPSRAAESATPGSRTAAARRRGTGRGWAAARPPASTACGPVASAAAARRRCCAANGCAAGIRASAIAVVETVVVMAYCSVVVAGEFGLGNRGSGRWGAAARRAAPGGLRQAPTGLAVRRRARSRWSTL